VVTRTAILVKRDIFFSLFGVAGVGARGDARKA
jgi:hypothetical protein